MSSSAPEASEINSPNPHLPKAEVSDSNKERYKKFMETFSLNNNKVRYYCNKTLSLGQPLQEILDNLAKVQYHAMAYLPPESETSDHFVLSMIFTLISKTATLIDWSTLNHDCFWKDFCRETKALNRFVEQVQLVLFDAAHTVTERANRASEIFDGVIPIGNKIPNPRLKSTLVQADGDPSPVGIKVIWMEPMEAIIIQWNNGDEVESIRLQQTGDGFRIRFLRCLILYARKSLELLHYAILRTDLSLRMEFPLEKLEKCGGITFGQLVPSERSALSKAKRDFDGSLDDILVTVLRFKFQLDQMEMHKSALKHLRKNPTSCPKLSPAVNSVSVHLEDPILSKIISRAITVEMSKESYDFTIYPDRTEDIVCLIEDMWKVDETSYNKIDQLLILVYTALTKIQPTLSKLERNIFKDSINDLIIERERAKRYLKKSLKVFSHDAFKGMPIQHNGNNYSRPTTPGTSSMKPQTTDNDGEGEGEGSESDFEDDEFTSFTWIELQGGYQVTISEEKEFLVLNQFKDQLRFNQLDEEQKLVLTTKMIERLLHLVSTEGCLAKLTLDRATETKSLVKRLKQNDRFSDNLGSIIGHGIYYIRQMKQLMKTMDIMLNVFT